MGTGDFECISDYFGIAVIHSLFNIACTALLFPMSSLLEQLAIRLVPETKDEEAVTELDERLLVTPTVALERCNELVNEMADFSVAALKNSLRMLQNYDSSAAEAIRKAEKKADHYEDILGTYLVKLSSYQVSDTDSAQISKLLKVIGDFERISDHSVNLLEAAEEMREKSIRFTAAAGKELEVLCSAVDEILDLSGQAFLANDLQAARDVEPLEQVIDGLKEKLRDSHIRRLKNGECSIEAGFVWADLLTDLERTSDHCSNVALCVIDVSEHNMNMHQSLKDMKQSDQYFKERYQVYLKKYALVDGTVERC